LLGYFSLLDFLGGEATTGGGGGDGDATGVGDLSSLSLRFSTVTEDFTPSS